MTTIRIAPTAFVLNNSDAYTLINYAGALAGDASNFNIVSETRYSFALDFSVTNKILLRAAP